MSTFEKSHTISLFRNPETGLGQSAPYVVPTLTHGALRSITVVGAGTKIDNNANNYTFSGHRHMHKVFTDLESAITAEPSVNTKEGWLAHSSGIYPITGSTGFNSEATQSGATIEMTGGPTQSGKYLQRKITTANDAAYQSNSRLRNWNLDTLTTGHGKGKIYSAFYLRTMLGDYAGKFYRAFMTTPAPLSENFWIAFGAGNGMAWRAEDGEPLSQASDQTFALAGEWHKFEVLLDYDNDQYAIAADGVTITQVSRGKNGWVSGFLGAGAEFNYALLGNTIQTLSDGLKSDIPVRWAQPIHDYDFRRVMIADSAVWSAKTSAPVSQPIKSWAEGDIQFIVNKGHFTDLTNKHVFYVDGLDATYIGALE